MRWEWLGHSYHREIVESGKQPIFLLLLGLILGFVVIRTSTRMIRAEVSWWPGNISAGGVHLHHEIFGVLTLLVTGTLAFASPTDTWWHDLLAFLFGVGGGLVLDEFALLLHLQDVYWTKQGQASIDAVIVAVLLTGMLIVRAVPFGIGDVDPDEAFARWVSVSVSVALLGLTVVCTLKGKPWLALISVFLPFIGLIGAIRLAASGSRWAKRMYAPGSRKAVKASARTARWVHRKQRLVVAIGGSANAVVGPDGEPVPAI
jgi:branched-subunit amino acid transport protein AzlD